MKFMLFPVSLALVLLTALTPFAQQPGPPEPKPATEKQKELEQQAMKMLDDVVADVRALKLPENRVRALANLAHLLWPRDEKRARELFEEAVSNLLQANQEAANDSDLQEPRMWQRKHLRGELLGLIAQHDAALALKTLAATREAAPESGASDGTLHDEARMAMQLASQLVTKAPRQALAAASELIERGEITGDVSNVLGQLWQADRAAGVELAGKLIPQLNAETFANNPEAFGVAGNLLNLLNSQDAAGDQSAAGNQPTLSASSVRTLIEQLYAAARSGGPEGPAVINQMAWPILQQLQSSITAVEKYAPDTAAAVKKAAPQVQQFYDPDGGAWSNLNRLAEQGSVEAILAAAPKAPPQIRNEYYQRAANLALGQGNVERARQIIGEHVTDPMQRKQALANVDRQVLWKATQESRLEEARALALKLPTLQERVQQLTQLAAQAFAKNNREQGLALLDEARAMVGRRAANHSQLWAQLQVAGGYAKVVPERGFAMIEPMTTQVDELASAFALVEGFGQNGGYREGEMLLQNGGMLTILLQQYGQTLAALARADFERARTLVARFQRPEARIIAGHEILQGILATPQANGTGIGVSSGGGVGGGIAPLSISPRRRR